MKWLLWLNAGHDGSGTNASCLVLLSSLFSIGSFWWGHGLQCVHWCCCCRHRSAVKGYLHHHHHHHQLARASLNRWSAAPYKSELSLGTVHTHTTYSKIHVAQLSQRDRAAGRVSCLRRKGPSYSRCDPDLWLKSYWYQNLISSSLSPSAPKCKFGKIHRRNPDFRWGCTLFLPQKLVTFLVTQYIQATLLRNYYLHPSPPLPDKKLLKIALLALPEAGWTDNLPL